MSGIPSLPFHFSDGANAIRRIAETINAMLLSFGQWLSPAFNAANFSASGAMTWTVPSTTTYAYTLINKTLLVAFNITGTAGGTLSNALQIAIPGGYVATQTVISVVNVYSNGVWGFGQASASANIISITNSAPGNTNYTAGTVIAQGQIALQVN